MQNVLTLVEYYTSHHFLRRSQNRNLVIHTNGHPRHLQNHRNLDSGLSMVVHPLHYLEYPDFSVEKYFGFSKVVHPPHYLDYPMVVDVMIYNNKKVKN